MKIIEAGFKDDEIITKIFRLTISHDDNKKDSVFKFEEFGDYSIRALSLNGSSASNGPRIKLYGQPENIDVEDCSGEIRLFKDLKSKLTVGENVWFRNLSGPFKGAKGETKTYTEDFYQLDTVQLLGRLMLHSPAKKIREVNLEEFAKQFTPAEKPTNGAIEEMPGTEPIQIGQRESLEDTQERLASLGR